ncbi:MAG: DNA topoisomerase IV subunit A [Bacilli bacterium]|nr:DNA topoisomerase IV subunit A [Bacilli bacterium]
MEDIVKKIQDYALEDIMGDRFARYAKAIIQDRAIPDVRDGLKPVQRRILYGMYHDHNTYDKPTRKSAKTVGYIMGNFHPHGDSSIYDAMVRMSQWWKQSTPYIDMQGNNGSMDGDGAAAMRYTEARLSKISNELLKDIDKDTVEWAPNFDDTELEPTTLPAKFPNLLVNGANGISAGYATNIPPHNLGEVIDATIKRIDSPNCRLDTILDIVKGPDFPTGGIVEGKQGIVDAFTKGRGKVIVKAKTEFVKEKGKEQIIITEIPFDVNKALLVQKIDGIRIDKKIDGMVEVRDESDRTNPVRIVIDLKKDANKDLILNYLYKNSDLQISYNYNMVAIVNRRPMTLGILPILDAYIEFQKETITRRTKFDLATYEKRLHIVDGFLKMISILDEVIKTIRASKNKSDAKENLVKKFEFSQEQAEAIVVLQLYRLTNTDVVELEEEQANLKKYIAALNIILNDESKLRDVMKHELKKIKDEYATPRKTEVKDEITEIKIDVTETIPKEDVIVIITKEGYVKRVSKRSYNKDEQTLVKDGDYIIGEYELNTLDTVLIFTSLGNYLYVPVYEMPDLKWKEMGKHISNIIKVSPNELVVSCLPVKDFNEDINITFFTKNGMIKRTRLSEFKASRYTKPINCMKLKGDDEVVSVETKNGKEVFVSTYTGYGLRYSIDEVPVVGLSASGVKSISLKNDYVVSGHVFDENLEYLTVITSKNTAKRVRLSEFEVSTRARRGLVMVRDVKTNPYRIIKTFIISNKSIIGIKSLEDIKEIKDTEAPILDRYSTGSNISSKNIVDAFKIANIEKEEKEPEKDMPEEVDLKSIDERIMTIDDFLDNIEE